MALVLCGWLFNIATAFPVGRITNSTLRLRVSCFTSFITGRAPKSEALVSAVAELLNPDHQG